METNKYFYTIGKVLLFVLIIAIIGLYVLDVEKLLEIVPPCAFFSMTGLYCPGCGGTRALVNLLKGNIVRSFMFHPFVLYFVVTYSVFMVYEFCKKHFGIFKKNFPIEVMLYVGVGVLLIQWIIKVILQFVL